MPEIEGFITSFCRAYRITRKQLEEELGVSRGTLQSWNSSSYMPNGAMKRLEAWERAHAARAILTALEGFPRPFRPALIQAIGDLVHRLILRGGGSPPESIIDKLYALAPLHSKDTPSRAIRADDRTYDEDA